MASFVSSKSWYTLHIQRSAFGSRKTRTAPTDITNKSTSTTKTSVNMTETMAQPTGLDTYKVDFAWKSFKGVITDNKTNDHIMDFDSKRMTKPQVKFFKGSKENIIGTASLNTVSIHAECEIRGRSKRIQAIKRWTTEYTYLSDGFADGGLPVAMYWTSSSGKSKTTSRERDSIFPI
jgi:hypothetical protein